MKTKSLLMAIAISTCLSATHAQSVLTVAAESHQMIWNGVAVDKDRVFVSGPRWTGSKGPAVALVAKGGQLEPYPSADWNNWKPGKNPRKSFVDINAIHRDDHGSLWVVDTGGPTFGGDPLPGGAKVVQIDLKSNKVQRVYPLGADIALSGSYVDDIRFNGSHAYLTDAGNPGLIVLDIEGGKARRVLDRHSSTTAPAGRDIVLSGNVLRTPNGKPLHVNSDPLELSPDKRWLYYGPLEGPWSRIETRYLDDGSLSPEQLASHVEAWADLPPTGGTVMDSNGDLYFSDLATDSLKKRTPDGTISTIAQDPALHWIDGSVIDEQRRIWLPVPQVDRVALLNGGKSLVKWPVRLYVLDLKSSH